MITKIVVIGILLVIFTTLSTMLIIKMMVMIKNIFTDHDNRQKAYKLYANAANVADKFYDKKYNEVSDPGLIATKIFIKWLNETAPNLDPNKKIHEKLLSKINQAENAIQKAYARVVEVKSNMGYQYVSELQKGLKGKEFSLQNNYFQDLKMLDEYLDLIIEHANLITGSSAEEFEDSEIFNIDQKNYYETLGIDVNSTSDEIIRSYKKLASLLHPDRFQQIGGEYKDKAEEFMKKLNEAYSVLKDSDKRKEYDKMNNI